MIASLGGAIVNKDGSRNYPASGGYVGGLSFAGGNWAYFTGAGKSYEKFTPYQTSNSIPNPMELPQEPTNRDLPHLPIPTELPIPQLPSPTIPTTTTTTTTNTPPVFNCLWGNCDGSTQIPSMLPSGLTEYLRGLLTPAQRTNVNAPPTLFSFNPIGESSNMNITNIAIVVAVIAVAYWLYKKYA